MLVKFSSKKHKSSLSACFNSGQLGHFAQNCPKQKQKFSKGQHCAKRAEEQEDTDSGEIEMFVATVRLRADTQSNDWIVDSGASRHMTFESNVLHDYKDFEASELVGLGDVIPYLLLELVRSRSLHNYTMVKVLFVG